MFERSGEPGLYHLGTSLGDVGDVNGDGVAELLAGDPESIFNGLQTGSAFVFSGICGEIASYGSGCGGSGGHVPSLSITSCATPGAPITFDIQNGWGGGIAWLIAGPSPSSIPTTGGCTLLVFPFGALYPLPMSGSGPGGGSITLTTVLPISMGLGTAYLQAVVDDPGHSRGFSMTNGVRMELR